MRPAWSAASILGGLCALPLASPAVAGGAWQFWVANGALGASACPQGATWSDGCPGAIVGTTQHADFFTGYAAQSRPVNGAFTNATMPGISAALPSLQPVTGVYPVRPPWNVAGVDYAVGLPAGQVLQDPAVAALPTGCSINAAGSKPRRVTCSSSAQDLVFDGWDFGANNCVQLQINASAAQGSKVAVRNSRFVWGTNCEVGANTGEAAINLVAGSTITKVTLTNNLFDGRARDFGGAIPCPPLAGSYYTQSCAQQVIALLNGTYDVQASYNTFLDAGARFMQIYSGGQIIVRNNYIEGLWGNSAHAEFMLTFAPTPAAKSPLWEFGYNTVLEPGSIPNAENSVPLVFAGAGTQVALHVMHHNTEVNNLLGTSLFANLNAPITDGMTFQVGAGPVFTFRNSPSAATDIKISSDQVATTTPAVTAAANNMRVTMDNLVAALNAATDADTSHYTWISGWWTSNNQIFAQGVPTVAITGTSVAQTNQLSTSYLNRDGRETADVLAYQSNYMDPTGTRGCLYTSVSGGDAATIGAYLVSGNVNMLKAPGVVQPSPLSVLNDAVNPDSTANVTPCDGRGP